MHTDDVAAKDALLCSQIERRLRAAMEAGK